MKQLSQFLPFLKWFPLRADVLKADLIAGITVALFLIPQAMAYAQLAGLPAYYGLYAAFLPVMLGALWGSSAQLSTGPAAIVSLLTGTALAPLALSGSEQLVALAILLALMVGGIQLLLGLFKLGVVVNMLSHPVIVGFTNAAAIVIGLSQLNKLMGVPMKFGDHFFLDIWALLQQTTNTHIPTLLMGLGAMAIIWLLKKYMPVLPGVLIALVVTTAISWAIGFEHNSSASIDALADSEAKNLVAQYSQHNARLKQINQAINDKNQRAKQLQQSAGSETAITITLHSEIEMLKLEQASLMKDNRASSRALSNYRFERTQNKQMLYLKGHIPAGEHSDGYLWRFKSVQDKTVQLSGGGEILGTVPIGIPSFGVPTITWNSMSLLFSTAFVIALIGYVECISIAKSFATKTHQRIDPNQLLIGQGLANIVGSFNHAFPVSASFSRSAVNFRAGAKTGMSSVFAGLFVLLTLLLLTPLLFYIPLSALAGIIMMAVAGLINIKSMKHSWQAHKHDGFAAILTFFATLFYAPWLGTGILVGASLAIILYLGRTMKPRVLLLGRHSDGTLRDAHLNNLPTSKNIIALRFDGCLYFGNLSYFEDSVLEMLADKPNAKYLLLLGDGINQLDASGEEYIRQLVKQLRENGIATVFCGMKKQVLDVMKRTGLHDIVGHENFFRNEDQALESIYSRIDGQSTVLTLLQPRTA